MSLMITPEREGKKLNDVIFSAGAAVRKAIEKYGKEPVVNATLGAFMTDDGNIGCIPTVEKLYKSLPMEDFIRYAPPVGIPGYKEAVLKAVFADQQPDGYVDAVASSGGTGAVHMAIANYSKQGDQVLTADWRWDAYGVLCGELGRQLATFQLFDDQQHFNSGSFCRTVDTLLQHQDSLLIILNTPAHNPTGYGLTLDDWDDVLDVCKAQVQKGKKISLLADIAYIDYSGEKNEVRRFMKKFSGLPENLFVMFAFSMSKGYTLYGQRAGAIVGISSSKAVIEEFKDGVLYSGRAAWSNVNRAAMTVLTTIQNDAALYAEYEGERDAFFHKIQERAKIFMDEAQACALPALPYEAGFFISIPSKDSAAVCNKLHEDLIFAGPLAMGVRFAVCSVPASKMPGVAAKIKKAMAGIDC